MLNIPGGIKRKPNDCVVCRVWPHQLGSQPYHIRLKVKCDMDGIKIVWSDLMHHSNIFGFITLFTHKDKNWYLSSWKLMFKMLIYCSLFFKMLICCSLFFKMLILYSLFFKILILYSPFFKLLILYSLFLHLWSFIHYFLNYKYNSIASF